MKLELKTAAYETNIARLLFTDKDDEIASMEISLKNKELAKQYRNRLVICLRMNTAGISDGCDSIKPLNFYVAVDDCVVVVYGNLVNALKLMEHEKLISSFVCNNMLLDTDEHELRSFFENNKRFFLLEPIIGGEAHHPKSSLEQPPEYRPSQR